MSKVHSGKNYFLLALAIVYCIIAGIQLSVDGLLSTQLYFSVAFISVGTTGCEFAKSAIKLIRLLNGQVSDTYSTLQSNIRKHINVLGQFPSLAEITDQYKKDAEKMKVPQDTLVKKRWEKVLEIIETIIPFIEAFLILFFCLITPLKKIPNDLQTTKVINILSILSVALAFWSIFVNEAISEMVERNEERFRGYFQASDYYLNIIELISMKQPKGNNTDTEGAEKPQKDNH